jgi:hypothetical protein
MILKGGSPAIHKTGDISRDNDDYIRIHSEDKENYIGNFEEGFGFIDVKFNKLDCRHLTSEERNKLNGSWYSINGNSLYRIYVDEEGNIFNGKVKAIKSRISKILSTLTNEEKYSPYNGMLVEYGEDITIGRSLIMFTTDCGYIQTSTVNNYEYDVNRNCDVVYTKNSIYYLERI